MTPQQWQRLKNVFQDALEQPAHARREWVAAHCADDVTVLREAEAIAAEARLGFCSPEEEHQVFVKSIQDIRKRFAKLGITIPLYPAIEKAA